jgi:hypothetical protein
VFATSAKLSNSQISWNIGLLRNKAVYYAVYLIPGLSTASLLQAWGFRLG